MATLSSSKSTQPVGRQAIPPYTVVRITLGLLLLAAAALKAHQLATSPTLAMGDSWLDSVLHARWFQIVQVEFELLLGLWLLSGLHVRATRWVAVSAFGLFAVVALYMASIGAASCGCFGKVQVNPWYTFALDVGAVVALSVFRPAASSQAIWRLPRRAMAGAVAVAWLATGLPAAYAAISYTPNVLAADGLIDAEDDLVILEPEKWIGQPFPLIPYIDIGEQLKTGEWLVVLYKHDCSHCMEVLPEYERLAQRNAHGANRPRVALIELPPYAPDPQRSVQPRSPHVVGRLADAKEWFVQTPSEIRLRDGMTQ